MTLATATLAPLTAIRRPMTTQFGGASGEVKILGFLAMPPGNSTGTVHAVFAYQCGDRVEIGHGNIAEFELIES